MSKKKGGGGGGHDGAGSMRWLLTYSDMITLLLALFIMLYAISEVDKEKFASVAASIRQAFGGGNQIVNVGGVGDGVTIPRPGEKIQPLDPKAIADVLEQLGKGLAADFERDGRFTVHVSERGLTISLAGNSFFDSGKADLKPEMLPLLDDMANRLKAMPNDISVEGFTDSDPIHTAEFPSNWYLSVARANRVRDYLEARGVAASRLIVVGYGETRPLYENTTPEGKAKNRRVDVVILRQKVQVDLGKEIDGEKK